MKPTGRQFNVDPNSSMARYATNPHSTTTTGILGLPIYLTQQSALHPSFSPSQVSGVSPHGARDFHGHPHSAIHGVEITGGPAHRSHLVNAGTLGLPTSHSPMPVTQHRRSSSQRLSLLRDIGKAGERERDRSESSSGSMMPHPFTTASGGHSHLITNPLIYGSRPTMLGSMNPNLLVGPMGSQVASSVPPRHGQAAAGAQVPRTISSVTLTQYPGTHSALLQSGQPTIKSEPGSFSTFAKEEPVHLKSPLHPTVVQSHLAQSQLPQGHPYHGHPSQQVMSIKNEQTEKESESRPAKEELLQAMDKVDKEITKVQGEVSRLERKRQQLENTAKKPPQAEKPASPKKVEPKHRDLWQVIYAENKKKAEAARAMLDHLGPRYEMPLYNQPCDTAVYQENLKKNEEMRPKLLAYFQRKSQLSNIRERYLCARYDQLMADWQKKAEKVENNIKRKAKEAKVRDFFEKQFPEIRKQREQQERFSRSGTRGDTCRSEADFNEIVDGLTEQEHHEQNMRQLAVVPPMLLDRDERRLKFINNNGLVMDPLEDYKKQQELDHWSTQEKQIFKEKYIQHPKNFQAISSFLEKKSVADCVLFYYLSKKKVGYKLLVRKNTLKPRKPKSGRSHTQGSAASAGQDLGKTGQMLSDKTLMDKDGDQRKEPDMMMKEEEVERIDRPPSPRITRSRNKNLNWTDEDINTVKEGFGKHGKDFAAISRLFTNKTEHQVKNFYHNYKKKHNLDQLISDSKKKKPNEGSRRTRTNIQPLEAASNMAEDEMQSVADTRPRSAEPQISTLDSLDGSRKKKKDAESEKDKKDESAKSDDGKKVEQTDLPVPGKSNDAEVVTSRASTPGATLPYRTRRSAAAANGTGDAKSDSAKRSSDRSPVEEPAEKKIKKSKNAGKEGKLEKEIPATGEKKRTEVKLPQDDKEGVDELVKKEVAKNEAPTPASAPSSITDPALSENTPTFSATVTVAPVPFSVTSVSSIVTVPLTTTVPVAVSSSPAVTEIPQATPGVTKVTGVPTLQLSQKKRLNDNDGDSSATCSADEEPNLQDVAADASKANQLKHVDSPYAFDDDSSTSIKLETSRVSEPPKSTTSAPVTVQIPSAIRQAPPKASEAATADRPSSTYQPPQTALKPQLVEKRPQSLPPPPGAIAGPVSAVGPVRFQVSHLPPTDSRPSSTPMFAPGYFPIGAFPGPPPPSSVMTTLPGGPPYAAWPPVKIPEKFLMSHDGKPLPIVGNVPLYSELRNALQISSGPLRDPNALALVRSTAAPIRPEERAKPEQIDLTKSQEPAKKETPINAAPLRPQPHPVPTIASSLQRDVTPLKVEGELSKVTSKGRKEQSAVFPVFPVSSLRFHRTSPPPNEAASAVPERAVKKETLPWGQEARDRTVPGRRVDPPTMHPGLSVSSHLSISHPPVITSSVQTKFVSGSMTQGNPVLQKQPGKPLPMEEVRLDLKPSMSDIQRGSPYTQPPIGLDSAPKYPLVSRASIVKGTPIPGESAPHRRTPGLDDVVRNKSPSPSMKSYPGPHVPKSVTGSIMTGQPVQQQMEKPEKRNPPNVRTAFNIIPNRPIRVHAPVTDPARPQDSKMLYEHPSHPQLPYPASRFPLHPTPVHIQGAPAKPDIVGLRGTAPAGSILTGAPVKRKQSDESNSSLSPSASQVPYSPAPSSRPSPSIKPQERKPPMHPVITENKRFHEEIPEMFQGSRRTPDKMAREPTPRCMASSPGHRSTPTGILSQHPTIKQEVPGSPRSAEDPHRRSSHLDHARSLPSNLTNPEFLRMQMLPYHLGVPGVTSSNAEALEILRQYGGAHSLFPPGNLYPFHGLLPGSYPSNILRGIGPTGSPMSPRSPQTAGDDGMEATKKMLHQDFMTAQHMLQRNPVTGAAAILHGTAPHLVAGANAFMGAQYHPAGLPVDRLNYPVGVQGRVRSPFSPQYHSPSGRSSITRSPIPISPSESSRSPVHRPPKAASPEIVKHRDRTSDPIHPTLKEQNSATSPLSYHSPRGSTSPRDCYTPQGSQNPHQLSPSQRVPVTTKPYYMYPSSSTPPVNIPYHPMTASPRSMQPQSGSDILSEATKSSRSSPYLAHSRSESLDAGKQFRQERSRPDSAGPRSMPQSPNIPHGHESKTQQSHPSPKPMMQDRNKQYPAPGRESSRGTPVKQEDFYMGQQPRHRNSPKPAPKPSGTSTSGHMDTRHQIGHAQGVATGSGHRQSSRSPCPPPQHIIHGVPTYPNETPKLVRKPPQPRPKDPNAGASIGDPERITSKNPGEDLKRSGKAKMTAASLIDAIININYHTDQQGFPQMDTKGAPQHRVIQPVHHGKQTGAVLPGAPDKPPTVGCPPHHGGHLSPQAKHEAELKTSVAPANPRLPQMAYAYRGMVPSGVMVPGAPVSELQGQHQPVSTHSSPTMQNRTLLEHSSDVINECYRKKAEPRSSTPPTTVKSESPQLPRSASGNLLTEPISPPEGRSGGSRGEPAKKSVTQQQTPYQPQQAMFAPHLSPQRHPTSSAIAPQAKLEQTPTGILTQGPSQPPQARLPHTPPVDPMNIGNAPVGGNNNSLEEIIRKALLQNSMGAGMVPPTSDSRRPQDIPHDPFITHAVMSMGMQRPMKHVPASPPQPTMGKPQEQWKEPSKQPQSQSGGYMSALFLRQMPTNSSPGQGAQAASDADRQQPFYGGQATSRPRHAHQGPAQQSTDGADCGDQQQRPPQAPTMLPQYEALSDSD